MRSIRGQAGEGTKTRRFAVDQSEVVGQLVFAEADGGVVHLDVFPSAVRHPSGRLVSGAPFSLTVALPADHMWASLLGGVLERWADKGERLGIDLVLEQRPVVRLCSVEAMMRLDLVTPVA